MAKHKKAKSKKSCGINPFCHLMEVVGKIRTRKNRIKYDLEDMEKGKQTGNY